MDAYEYDHRDTAGLHYTGPDRHGAQITIDVAELSPGLFDVVVRRSDGGALANEQAASREDAEKMYRDFYRRHVLSENPPAPLTGKYAKLRDDLKKALEAGRAAEDADPEDGGSCTLDAAALALPRWTVSKVEQAAKEAGTGCFVATRSGERRFVFSPDTGGQGNARRRNAEAMTAALRAAGYDAIDYSRMD